MRSHFKSHHHLLRKNPPLNAPRAALCNGVNFQYRRLCRLEVHFVREVERGSTAEVCFR
jgi:hypothetical protein